MQPTQLGYEPIKAPKRRQDRAVSKRYRRTLARLAHCDTFLTDGLPLPLPIMIYNMRLAFDLANQADAINPDVVLASITDANGKVDVKQAREALKAAAAQALDIRDKSQAYAVAAAPFIHPRLTAVQVKHADPSPPNGDDATLVEAIANAPPSPLMLELSAWGAEADKLEQRTTEAPRPAKPTVTADVQATETSPDARETQGYVGTPGKD